MFHQHSPAAPTWFNIPNLNDRIQGFLLLRAFLKKNRNTTKRAVLVSYSQSGDTYLYIYGSAERNYLCFH